jgi:outer membrane protein
MKRVFLFVCMCVFSAAFASAGTSYTVASAVECALANNISIKQSQLSLDSLERKKGISWNGLLPSLSAGAGASKTLTETETKTATGTVTETNPVSAYGSLNASLSASATLFTAVKGAQLEYEAGLISRESASRAVELSVRKAFYGILCDQANVDVLTSTLATAKKNHEQTLANRKVGLASELDALSAEVAVEDLRLSLLSAENALANDLSSFKSMLGIGEDEEISLVGSPEDALPAAEIEVSGIAGKSAEVASAEKTLESAKLAAIRANAQAWSPVFSLSMNYRYSTVDIDQDEWTDNATVTAAVTVPLDGLIPWSASNSSRNSASETVRNLELQLASVSSSAKLKTESLQRKIRQSLTTLDARDMSVRLAEKSYAMTEQAYRSGAKDMLALQTSSDSLLKAKLLRMQEVYSLVSSILDLESALGVPFGTLGR